MISKERFGENFHWGVSSSAFQTEGIFLDDGKGLSIWDQFTKRRGKIRGGDNAKEASLFYKKYREDIELISWMGLKNFRFSIAWSRILPEGIGTINHKGIDFYDRLIDFCLEKEVNPWITLYHWDLPLVLEKKGGWRNRDILLWFEEYLNLCATKYADRVNNWMILNEPTAYTALGYFMGIHAPGKKGLKNFLPAMHHTALVQAEGGRLLKSFNSNLNVGTTFSFSHVKPYTKRNKDLISMQKVDALLNRLYLEPLLGYGYPFEDLEPLQRVEKYMLSEDESKLAFDFDFIGVQNYSREVVAHSYFMPIIKAKRIAADKRGKDTTAMGWEYYPKGILKVLRRLGEYENLPPIIISESGVALEDQPNEKGYIRDERRIKYMVKSLKSVLKAKKEGINVKGYFVWSLTDNFEWAEGYYPRFGLVYIDYKNQKRVPKDSSKWFKKFLAQ